MAVLSREIFRESVFKQDGHKCVCCSKPAVDAHHILERRLFTDGGYYLDNGASVCEEHHLAAERTVLSVEELHERINCKSLCCQIILYMKRELFHEKSVQKVLKEGGGTKRIHLQSKIQPNPPPALVIGVKGRRPRVEGLACLGRKASHCDQENGQRKLVLIQRRVACQQRGQSQPPKPKLVEKFHAQIQGDIPENWRVCGANLFAKHQIGYDQLPSYCMGFSVWNEKNVCLSWDETLEWFTLLGVEPVPVIYESMFDETLIRKLWDPKIAGKEEGYVIRVADAFTYTQFKTHVGKFVRENHIQTTKH